MTIKVFYKRKYLKGDSSEEKSMEIDLADGSDDQAIWRAIDENLPEKTWYAINDNIRYEFVK